MIKNNEVPKEIDLNHISVVGVGLDDYSYAFYNPHNARFYFDFAKWNFKPDFSFSRINGSELCLKDFNSCRVVVKKNLIEITNKVNKDRVFKIDGSSDQRKNQVIDAVSKLELECIDVLKEFIKLYGGSSSFVCVKSWIPDNKILHDKIVDSIPNDVTFRNDVVKKVYNTIPKNVEVSSPASASNTFRNLALYDFAPIIASEINSLHSAFDRFTIDALNPLTEQIKLHLEVQRETLATLKDMRDNMKKDKLKSLKHDWGW